MPTMRSLSKTSDTTVAAWPRREMTSPPERRRREQVTAASRRMALGGEERGMVGGEYAWKGRAGVTRGGVVEEGSDAVADKLVEGLVLKIKRREGI